MIEGVLLAGSALLGGALALLARRREVLLELTRTFAFTAAASVVVFHLLPEVLPRLGPTALLWIAGGFALPWLLEVGAHTLAPDLLARRGIRGMRVAAEVGFLALLFHSLFEGLALLATSQGRDARDIQIAILAHHAPLTAAVALPFLDLLGVRAALLRVGLVAVAGALGVALGNLVPGLASGADAAVLQRATAVVAGALLHVVADEIRDQRFSSARGRVLDLLAAAAGLALAGLGVVLEVRTSARIAAFARTMVALALGVAPALVASIAAEAAARRFRIPGLARAPFEGLFATGALLGWPSAAVRAGLAALVSVAPRLVRSKTPEGPPALLVVDLARRAPWLVVLLVVAAGVDALAPPGWFRAVGPAGLVLVCASLAASSRASASGAALLLCALVHRGFSVGLALPFLALGVLPLRRAQAARSVLLAVLLFPLALAAGAGLERLPFLRGSASFAAAVLERAQLPLGAQLASAPAATACTALLVLLALALALRSGVRGWFAPFRHADGHASEAHGHEHATA